MTSPDWRPVIIDGQPEAAINAAAMARLVRASPLGVVGAMAELRKRVPAEHYAAVFAEVCR